MLTLLETQRGLLFQYCNDTCPDQGAAIFEEGMRFILHCFNQQQSSQRCRYTNTLEDTCSAANDYWRLSERLETLLSDVLDKQAQLKTKSDGMEDVPLTESVIQIMNDAILSQLSQDAVQAAERGQIFILRHIQQHTTIHTDLFSCDWEDIWTRNEIMTQIVNVFDHYLLKMKEYLASPYLYHKSLLVTSRAAICFYIRVLVNKAEAIMRRRSRDTLSTFAPEKPFASPKRALLRMMDDIIVLQEFFESKTAEDMSLKRMIRAELSTLELIHDCLAVTNDAESLESFLVVIHKRTGGDSLITQHFVGDLWLLMAQEPGARSRRQAVSRVLKDIQPDLELVTKRLQERGVTAGKEEVSFVRLDEMLKALYEERIVHGMLPLCWTCLPRDLIEDGDAYIIGKHIRTLTRNVVKLGFGHKKPL